MQAFRFRLYKVHGSSDLCWLCISLLLHAHNLSFFSHCQPANYSTFTTGSAVDFTFPNPTKMTISRNILAALVALSASGKVNAAMGPAFSTGPTSSDTYVAESWATLNLPAAPSDNSGDLSLWVGMGTSNGDLIQSIAENYNADDWSVYAYTLMSTSGKCDRMFA